MTGDPNQLIKPHDSEGNICGQNGNNSLLFYFDLTRCLSVLTYINQGCPTKQICVEKCPDVNSII